MTQEYLEVFDDNMNPIGIFSRNDVHANGYWHKTFHCWVVGRDEDSGWPYILLQKRHASKDTSPNKFDVTAAGHLLAGETIAQGVREPEEELGLTVAFADLHFYAINKSVMEERRAEDVIVDKEFSHIFFYESDVPLDDYQLQVEEVAGLFKMGIEDGIQLFNEESAAVRVVGFLIDEATMKQPMTFQVTKDDFVARPTDYYLKVLAQAQRLLQCMNGRKDDSIEIGAKRQVSHDRRFDY